MKLLGKNVFSGWCTNCEGTWNSGSVTKYAQYVVLQETGWYYHGYYDYFHVAEIAFNLGRFWFNCFYPVMHVWEQILAKYKCFVHFLVLEPSQTRSCGVTNWNGNGAWASLYCNIVPLPFVCQFPTSESKSLQFFCSFLKISFPSVTVTLILFFLIG